MRVEAEVAERHGSEIRSDPADAPVPSAGARLQPFLVGFVAPFALLLYLALNGGGYDAIVRGEIGIIVWWVVLLGVLVGLLPTGMPASAAAAVGLFGAFTAWTALGISWSESSERSFAELARVVTFLGVLVLAVAGYPRDGLMRAVHAVGWAIGVVAVLALLSRLEPGWFPANDTAAVLQSARARLSYPLDYWNGLAALIAIGFPLLLAIGIEARRIVTRALATAALPVLAAVAFYTLSRGGALAAAIAVTAFFVLFPRKLGALIALLPAGVASVVLILAATRRDALEDGLSTEAALAQGDEMLLITIMACAGAGICRAALDRVVHRAHGRRRRVDRRLATAAAAGLSTAAAVLFVVAGGPGEVDAAWQEFKQPVAVENASSERFESASGNGRYQYWTTALDAAATRPLTGTGAGTYEYFWTQHRPIPGFARDAHSLFLETLAELGAIGLLLLASFVIGVIVLGARRALSADLAARPWFAAATAGCIGFAAAAAVDWVWELAAVTIAFILLAAGIVAHRESLDRPSPGRGLAPRLGLATLAVIGTAVVAIQLFATSSIRDSQDDARAGRLDAALEAARAAAAIEPWASTPQLQEALVLELQGRLDGAAEAAAEATRKEPTNWRTWVVLSRLEAYSGDVRAATAAYRKARLLNPRSPLFAR